MRGRSAIRTLTLLFCVMFAELAIAQPPLEVGARRSGDRISASSVNGNGFQSCAVNEDGTVSCWGSRFAAVFGGVVANPPTPTVVIADGVAISSVIAVSAASRHACALTAQGTVRCWGLNTNGEIGVGTTSPNNNPSLGVSTVTGLSNATAIEAGASHTCALTSDGAVRCWGANEAGQIGDGTTTTRPSPTTVPGLTNVKAVSSGLVHTCALKADSSVVCWGSNSFAQLGDGTTTSRSSPVPVPGLTNVVAISAGAFHTCALLADSSARCWGSNSSGQLGDGTTTTRTSSTPVSGLTNVASISAGSSFTCALLGDGSVRCWGANGAGQLGDGTNTPRLTPPSTSIPGLSNVVSISAGSAHACVLQSDNSVRCWGLDGEGQLGNGLPLANSNVPVVARGPGSISGRGITGGGDHTCARRAGSIAACWGENADGQLGNVGNTDSTVPVTVKTFMLTLQGPVPIDLRRHRNLQGGGLHTCANLSDGSLRCWGRNANGQLGTGTTTSLNTAPIPVISGLGSVIAVAAGQFHTCALEVTGKVKCWGLNDEGQLGNNQPNIDRSTPVTVQTLSPPVGGLSGLIDLTDVIALDAGTRHTCALKSNGSVFCWGDNSVGQTANNGLPSVALAVPGLTNAVAIALGGSHSCALLTTGRVRCFGSNSSGQLGDGTTTNRTVPVTVKTIGPGGEGFVDQDGLVAIGAGLTHTCAIRFNGIVLCWGENGQGQLGIGNTSDSHIALTRTKQLGNEGLIDLAGIVALGVGRRHTCALKANGQPFCWGDNIDGQLGIGSTTDFSAALAVPSFTFNVDPNVTLRENGRRMEVTALANCEAGQRVFIRVDLAQGDAHGTGVAVEECTGALSRFPLSVHAHGPRRFQEGSAHANAESDIRERRNVTTQQWTREVTLTMAP